MLLRAVVFQKVDFRLTQTLGDKAGKLPMGHLVQTRRTEPRAATPMKAVLLDRDGVINSLVYHEDAGVIDAPFAASQFKLLPRVPQAIRLLNDLGLGVAVVSNQPGIAKGHFKPEVLKACERKMLSGIRAAGGRIHGIYY